jgi:Protein of unknown function (DUF3489)
MSKLSDTQAIILSAASQRRDGNLPSLPGSLRGGAATKVVAALLARGFVEERVLDTTAKADAALNTVWRNLYDGRGVLLVITAAGRDALGLAPEDASVAAVKAGEAAPAGQGRRACTRAAEGASGTGSRRTREGTNRALLVDFLGRAEGATIDEIVAATGWQPHTVRGAFAGALKKRLGLIIVSEKVEGRGRVYRIGR